MGGKIINLPVVAESIPLNLTGGLPIRQMVHLRSVVDICTFLLKMMSGNLVLSVMRMYNQWDPEELNTFPGFILVYAVNLFLVPLWQSGVLALRFYNDSAIREFFKREVASRNM